MQNNQITITGPDGRFQAYIAMPEKTPAPVIIMIQEIFGINQDMRHKCDHMAALGYIAIAPDLFWRIEPGIELVDSIPEELQRAFHLYGEFDQAKGLEDLIATLKTARSLPGANGKIGCVGYCLGGKLAFMMATGSDVDAAVSYYGVGIESMLDDTGKITKPALLHIAGEDKFVPPEAQKQITEALMDVETAEAHIYPGMDHAFAREKGMHYNKEAADLANRRSEEFLATALRP